MEQTLKTLYFGKEPRGSGLSAGNAASIKLADS